MNTKQKELVESINNSLSSVFTKEDVISIIKNFQEAQEVQEDPKPALALDPDILRSVLCNIDFEDHVEKDFSIDGSAISFDIETDSRGGISNSFTIDVNVDESTIEDAVQVDLSLSDVDSLVDEILTEYANKLASKRVI